jgi:hypothetical protein
VIWEKNFFLWKNFNVQLSWRVGRCFRILHGHDVCVAMRERSVREKEERNKHSNQCVGTGWRYVCGRERRSAEQW